MKARISIFTLLAICMFHIAGAATALTKSEAQKLLVQYTHEYLFSNFNIDKFVKEKGITNDLLALKKEGYITITNTKTAGPGRVEIKATEKGKTLFAREEKGKLYFRVADVDIKITSLKETPPGRDGKTTYYVQYTEKLTRNRFMELLGVNHCFDGKKYPGKATLIQTKEGWKVDYMEYRD